ncbi:MAG: LarC family nickel insertion protein [Candidatus Binatia bacterium]|nr:LarC family nickel insertion protein [Candidatus Binatia bacterium]
MKIAYIDASAGLDEGMLMAALLHCGASVDALQTELAKLPCAKCDIRAAPSRVGGLEALQVSVDIAARHEVLDIQAAVRAVQDSHLSLSVKEAVARTLTILAEAVREVYGVTSEAVPELPWPRALVEIVAIAWALHELGIEQLYVSTLSVALGWRRPGRRNLLSPLAGRLLQGFLVRVGAEETIGITPVVAAILKTQARQGQVPPLRVSRVGYGVGESPLHDPPVVLPILVGDVAEEARAEELYVLETNIDDLNPEFYDYVMERLFAAGARDVFLLPIQMKKNRPGVLLWVLCHMADRDQLLTVLFSETTTLGIRTYPVTRVALQRAYQQVSTPYGSVRVKLAYGPAGQVHLAPEYEDCKRLAREKQVPLKVVYNAALCSARLA